jgi:hypothetical protein
MSSPPAVRTIRLGSRELQFPSADVCVIESCESLLDAGDGGAALRARFAADGFVFLRGALGAEAVDAARECVRAQLAARGGVLGADGLLLPECGLGCLPMLEGVNGTTHAPAVLRVLEGAPLRRAVGALLGAPPDALRSFDYKWLRAMPRGAFTGVHVDAVYMSRGSPSLLTAWIPFDAAATVELGALALLRGSHAAPALARLRETYGAFDTERERAFEGSGWLTADPLDAALRSGGACQWVTGDYAAGDVVIFGLLTAHCSTANLTDAVRISCDVRWQRADAPAIDDRYVGTREEMEAKAALRKKGGAWSKDGGGQQGGAEAAVSMEQLRQRWGI